MCDSKNDPSAAGKAAVFPDGNSVSIRVGADRGARTGRSGSWRYQRLHRFRAGCPAWCAARCLSLGAGGVALRGAWAALGGRHTRVWARSGADRVRRRTKVAHRSLGGRGRGSLGRRLGGSRGSGRGGFHRDTAALARFCPVGCAGDPAPALPAGRGHRRTGTLAGFSPAVRGQCLRCPCPGRAALACNRRAFAAGAAGGGANLRSGA